MTNHCVEGGKESDDPFASNFWDARVNPASGQPYTAIDPAARNAWGVDLNRNNTVGTLFDGYIGASQLVHQRHVRGPGEASEPEIKNEHWIADTFTNIKFANNIHSFGGYFMWAPGAYLPNRDEGDLDHAEHRRREVLLRRGRPDPQPDQGAPEHGDPAGAHGPDRRRALLGRRQLRRRALVQPQRHRLLLRDGRRPVLHEPDRRPPRQARRASGSARTRAGSSTSSRATRCASAPAGRTRRPGPSPRSTAPPPRTCCSPQPLSNAHPAGARVEGAALQTGVGFQPDYATEGKHEALEFAAGNYGLLESAFAYERDHKPPKVTMTGEKTSSAADRHDVRVRRGAGGDPVHDGRVDADRSRRRLWDSTGPREPGEVFHLTETTTFRWTATDIKGNVSHGTQKFKIDGS